MAGKPNASRVESAYVPDAGVGVPMDIGHNPQRDEPKRIPDEECRSQTFLARVFVAH